MGGDVSRAGGGAGRRRGASTARVLTRPHTGTRTAPPPPGTPGARRRNRSTSRRTGSVPATYDLARRQLVSHHYWLEDANAGAFHPPRRFVRPSELDLIAELAGLRRLERWADWTRAVLGPGSPALGLMNGRRRSPRLVHPGHAPREYAGAEHDVVGEKLRAALEEVREAPYPAGTPVRALLRRARRGPHRLRAGPLEPWDGYPVLRDTGLYPLSAPVPWEHRAWHDRRSRGVLQQKVILW